MKSGRHLQIIALLLGALLLTQILPVGAQAPASPKTRPELLEFDRKLCPVCRESELIIQAVKKQFPGQFVVRRLYIDEHQSLFRQYGVAIVPTQIFLDATGKEVFRHQGVFAREKLLQKLRELKFIQDGKK
jgi:thioredoxin 1